MHPARNKLQRGMMILMCAYYPLNKRDISCTWKRNCSLLTAWSSILVTFVETLVTLRPAKHSCTAPIFKRTRISTLGKERRSRLGEKLNPQFQSSVSTFDDYCVLIVQFSREKINIFKASSLERGDLELVYIPTIIGGKEKQIWPRGSLEFHC